VNQPTPGNSSDCIRHDLPDCTGASGNLTMTATDSTGNTLEFSQCVPFHKVALFANGFE